MNEENRQFYGAYAEPLIEREAWLVDKLQTMLDTISTDPELKPTEHILHRIKGAESLKEKLQKRDLTPDAKTGLTNLSDIIGVRLVVHFTGDVYEIKKAVEQSEDFTVAEVKDYIARPKKNGYRSLHMILKIPFTSDIPELSAEVQLRTIAMDCWASLEHQLRYKKAISDAELVEGELSRCASEMASVDLTMQSIRDMLRTED